MYRMKKNFVDKAIGGKWKNSSQFIEFDVTLINSYYKEILFFDNNFLVK